MKKVDSPLRVKAFTSHSVGFWGHLQNVDFSVHALSPISLHIASCIYLIGILNLYSGVSVLVFKVF